MLPWPPSVCPTLVGLKWQEKLVYLGALNPAFPSNHSKTLESKRVFTAC